MPKITFDDSESSIRPLLSKVKIVLEEGAEVYSMAEYACAVEAIGSIAKEIMKSRGCVTARDLQLAFKIRLKLATEKTQQAVLREALILLKKKTFS